MTHSKEAVDAAAKVALETWYTMPFDLVFETAIEADTRRMSAALTAALPHLAPQPTQSDVSRVLSISAYLAANCDAVDKGDGKARVTFKNANAVFLSALAAVRAEATLAEREKVWREAAKHCHDVMRSHLPDYFNSIADEAVRARTPMTPAPEPLDEVTSEAIAQLRAEAWPLLAGREWTPAPDLAAARETIASLKAENDEDQQAVEVLLTAAEAKDAQIAALADKLRVADVTIDALHGAEIRLEERDREVAALREAIHAADYLVSLYRILLNNGAVARDVGEAETRWAATRAALEMSGG